MPCQHTRLTNADRGNETLQGLPIIGIHQCDKFLDLQCLKGLQIHIPGHLSAAMPQQGGQQEPHIAELITVSSNRLHADDTRLMRS